MRCLALLVWFTVANPALAQAPDADSKVAVPREKNEAGPEWLGNAETDLAEGVREAWQQIHEAAECPAAEPVRAPQDSANAQAVALVAAAAAAPPAEEVAPPVVTEEPAPEPASLPPEEPEERPVTRWRYEQQTLFGVTRRSGGFGAHVGGTFLTSEYGGFDLRAFGFEANFVITGWAVLGGAVYGTEPVMYSDKAVSFVYGGFQPGIILWTSAVVHPRVDALFGGGTAFDPYTGATFGSGAVIVPRAALELNLSRALRLSGHLGWRFVDLSDDDAARFSGIEAGLTLRLGWM